MTLSAPHSHRNKHRSATRRLEGIAGIWLAFLCACSVAFGQSTGDSSFVGRVLDPDDAPIAGARVEIGSLRVVTDAQGAFSIRATPGGGGTMSVSAAGYVTKRVTMKVLPGSTVLAPVVLEAEVV